MMTFAAYAERVYCAVSSAETHEGAVLARIASAYAVRFGRRLAEGGLPTYIQVGPSMLDSKDTVADIGAVARWSTRMFFVEANPSLKAPLTARLASQLGALYGAENFTRHVSVISAALGDDDKGDCSFYCFNPHFPYPDHAKYCSVEKSWLLNRIKVGGVWKMAVPEPERLLVESQVRCLTPRSLLLEVGLAPADVDFLAIDAEGQEAAIVQKFLELDSFAPAVLIVECFIPYYLHRVNKHLNFAEETLAPMLQALSARGYTVFQLGESCVAISAALL